MKKCAITRKRVMRKGAFMRLFYGILTVCSLLFCAGTSLQAVESKTNAVLQEQEGNKIITSFSQAKQQLKKVYVDHLETFYCRAPYLANGTVIHPEGFKTPKYAKRSEKMEWEHIVPAENFGRGFDPWRVGHPDCVDKRGKPFKGRKCAEKVSKEFQLMVSDMYNLVPAIGAVNAMRSNFNFTEMHPSVESTFGTCAVKIVDRQVEPTEYTKGAIARTYFYIESAYPTFKISNKMRKLLHVWDKRYPVDKWECERAQRIEKIQKNKNHIVIDQCRVFGFIE